MSLILEALRRSEAERHRESLPESLARQQALLYAANKRAVYWPVFICLLLLVNLVVLGYLVYQATTADNVQIESHHQPAPINELAGVSSSATEPEAGVAAGARQLQAAPAAAITLSAARAALAKKLPAQTNEPAAVPAYFSYADKERSEQENAKLNDHAGGRRVQERITPGQALANGQKQTPPDFEAKSQRSPSDVGSLGKDRNPSGNEHESAGNAAFGVQQTDLSVPHINELAKAFLATLPRLVFASHIYSKESSGRRIMINDNYLREGEGFSGIRVIEITEDGVVLEKQNRRFLVPVVRDWSPAG